jgi:hypothetical protein
MQDLRKDSNRIELHTSLKNIMENDLRIVFELVSICFSRCGTPLVHDSFESTPTADLYGKLEETLRYLAEGNN